MTHQLTTAQSILRNQFVDNLIQKFVQEHGSNPDKLQQNRQEFREWAETVLDSVEELLNMCGSEAADSVDVALWALSDAWALGWCPGTPVPFETEGTAS